MAKHEHGPNPTSDNAQTVGVNVPIQAPSGQSLDQVREILFGGQARDLENRLSQLEQRFEGRLGEVHGEIKQHIDTLTCYLKKELAGLIEKLGEQREERSGLFQQMATRIDELVADFDRRFDASRAELSDVQRDTLETLEQKTRSLSDEMQHRVNDLSSMVSLEASQTRARFVDRESLSTMLAELSMSLTLDSTAAEAELFEVVETGTTPGSAEIDAIMS